MTATQQRRSTTMRRRRRGEPEVDSAKNTSADGPYALGRDDPRRLVALQREVLGPAELDLAADWFRPRQPSEIVSTVLSKLDGSCSDGTTRA